MTATESAHALDSATITLLMWKPGPVRAVAVAVVHGAHEGKFYKFYPDSIDLSFVAATDTAAIGIAFKLLIKAGIISKTGQFRRSHHKASNGRTCFEYQLVRLNLAAAWLRANRAEPVAGPQQEMFQ